MKTTLKSLPQDNRIALSGDVSMQTLKKEATAAEPLLEQIARIPCPSSPISKTNQGILRIGAWNAQQCHYPDESSALLQQLDLDIALFTELDVGLGRTEQRNSVEILSKAQGHGACYVPEFLELYSAHSDSEGWHCNAVSARVPFAEVKAIRLPDEADWLIDPRRGQRRFGGRVGLATALIVNEQRVVVCSVHLESDTNSDGRARQMRYLLDQLESFAAGSPILIGGDMNAGARHQTFDATSEAFFAEAVNKGFEFEAFNAKGPTSRISRIQNAVQQNKAHFDWFIGKGLRALKAQTIPATDKTGNAISDHDLIMVEVEIG